MIKLVVSEHCHDCPCFSATTETVHSEHDNKVEHYVTCIESDNCRHIRLYLESQLVSKENYENAIRTICDLRKALKDMKEKKDG